MTLNAAELAILVKVYDEASGALEKIEGKGNGVIGMFKALAPAIGAAFVGFASVEIIDKSIEKTKELGEQVRDLSMKTGLSSEASSHLLHAAEVTGVAYETLSKGLVIFAKNMTAAQHEAETNGVKMSDAARRDADVVHDAQQRMADATKDAQTRMSDATKDATIRMKDATRDRNEALAQLNHDNTENTRQWVAEARGLIYDYKDIIKDAGRQERDTATEIARAKRDLSVAQQEYAKDSARGNDAVVRAQERLADLEVRLSDQRIDAQERLAKNQDRLDEHNAKVDEGHYQALIKKREIEEKYADTARDTQEKLSRTIRDTQEGLARTYRDTQQTIERAGVKLTETTDKEEVDTKKFGLALTDLGFKMSDVVDDAGRLTEEGFDKLADSIAKMPASMQRTSDVVAIFGKNGAALEPLFALGAKGLRETAAEADKLGLTLSAENVEKIHEYAESHRKMNEALKGVQVQIGLYLMPIMTKFSDWFIAHQPEIRAFVDQALTKMNEVLKALGPPMSEVADGWLKITEYLAKHQVALGIVIGLIIALVVAFNPWIVLVPALIMLIGVLADNWDSLGESITGVAYAVRDVAVGAFNAVISFLRDHWSTILMLAGGPVAALAVLFAKHFDQIRDLAMSLLDFLMGIPGAILGLIGDVGDAAYQLGADIVSYIVDGIESAPGAIIDAITGLLPGGLDLGSIIPDLPGFPGHAAGVRYVAHDQIAILHRGESVRTSSETRGDSASGGVGGIHFYGDVTLAGEDLDRAAADVGYAMATELRGRGFAL